MECYKFHVEFPGLWYRSINYNRIFLARYLGAVPKNRKINCNRVFNNSAIKNELVQITHNAPRIQIASFYDKVIGRNF